MYKPLAFLLAVSMLLSVFVGFPVSVSAADADYIVFDEGAVLLDESYDGKNVLIQGSKVFSVTVSGATDVNIIFDGMTMDRRYASDTSGVTIKNLYNVATTLGWGSGSTYYAQTCPLLLTNNASATVAFRGANVFYAGTNRCRVYSNNTYSPAKNGGGFAGIQVDAGSTLTIAPSSGTLKVHGGHYAEADNANNVPDSEHFVNDGSGFGHPDGVTQNQLAGGAGIGGGAAWNTTNSAFSSYTAGTPGTIIINGGNIEAHGGHEAAGIGGGLNGAATATSITINGGNVTAYGGRWAAGIGDGDSLQNDWTTKYTDAYHIRINGGTVYAVGGVGCPGIGTTDEISAKQSRISTSGLEITISGGTVRAKSGYPSGFNPAGTTGYDKEDAAAAIGAGNSTDMADNSITISSDAEVIASGFGHYSITESGTVYDKIPTVVIDSEGYMFLGRFPELASREQRKFLLFEAQHFRRELDGVSYQYTKYVTQPDDGSTGDIYYYAPEAPVGYRLMEAGTDGTLENATAVNCGTTEDLKVKMEELKLALYVDETSVKILEVAVPEFFRSVAISLPKPEEHGGIYALRVPNDALYKYTGSSSLPKSGYIIITIDAREQGTISGELKYPYTFNIEEDSTSGTFTRLDVYQDGEHTDGRNGLIGDDFSENVYAYRVYIEHDGSRAYLYASFPKKDGTTATIELDGVSLDLQSDGTNWYISCEVDMTDVTEKTVRLKKSDSVTVSDSGTTYTPQAIVYKITIVKKTLYRVSLKTLDKTYDGAAVSPTILQLTDEDTGMEYIPTDDERRLAEYTYMQGTNTLDAAPKKAGSYAVSVQIKAETFTAIGSAISFTISKKQLTVSRIENALAYVTSSQYQDWKAPHPIENPGKLYLSGVVGEDDVSVTAESVYYNDITIGYQPDKITLTGISLSGADKDNYSIEATQTVFGQISYSLDDAIFRKEDGEDKNWDKFYPTDSEYPVTDSKDYHSQPNSDGVYDSHREYVYARTENQGEDQAVYALDIEFGDMYFTYTKAQWNPNEMVYDELEGESRWTGFDGVKNRVEIRNRSNKELTYTASCKIDFIHSSIGDATAGIRGDFYTENSTAGTLITGNLQDVPAATEGGSSGPGSPGIARCYIILSGVPQLGESDHYTVVGSVTVTFSRVERAS